ncbi:MAG TPA: glucose-6-phosphate dehydrogenase, partial [Acidimicrobiales bacterium]|nr:glucose-6-phosphate dehydrogenase [Acidimicrobiales bacterium]
MSTPTGATGATGAGAGRSGAEGGPATRTAGGADATHAAGATDTAHRPRLAPAATVTVVGASGDLAARKLFPAIAALARDGLLPERFGLVGVARTQMTDEGFRKHLHDAVPDGSARWAAIVDGARYVAGGYDDPRTYASLATVLDEVEQACGATDGNRLFYLAAVPAVFPEVITALGSYGKDATAPGRGWARVVIEKPFGHDLQSARELDAVCHRYFDESQIYRIDHYLGKETVQNVLALRFANAIFEPIWNRRYVDHVQVTVAEELGVEGRAGFYESAGAMRDIVQNHLMQVVALTGMEPPSSVEAKGIRDEKVKVIEAIEVLEPSRVAQDVVRAQYTAGTVDDEPVPGYREEPGVAPDSQTETYVAMKLAIDNWRWAGVPFYVRTGKRLAE